MKEDSAHISSSIFIDAIDDEFLCKICHDVLSGAVSCQNGHTFCKACLMRWLGTNRTCPVCKISLNSHRLTELRFVEAVLGKLLVKCEENTDAVDDIRRNLRKRKRKREIVDPKQSEDSAVLSTSHESVRSSVRCCWTGKFADLRKHMSEECDYRKGPCPNAGCEANCIERRHLADHLAQCPYR
jgi:hypothetical protein